LHFQLQFFAVTGQIVRIYANLGLHDFICNMPAWIKSRSEYMEGLQPKESAQRYTVPSIPRQFFWATVYKTVRLMLSGHCPVCLSVCLVCLSVLFVCNVGVLWPNSWMDQDETCYGGRPLSRSHCVRWGPSPPL